MSKRMIVCLLAVLSVGLFAGHHEEKGYLGVALGEDGEAPKGVLIESVYSGSAAETAGLEDGDLIISINGNEVITVHDLSKVMADFEVGDLVTVTIDRAGDLITREVELGNLPQIHHQMINKWVQPFQISKAYIGIEGETLGDQLAAYFDVESGVLITRVVEETPAAAAGLKAGDVVVGIAGKDVTSMNDLHVGMADIEPETTIDVSVIRKGKARSIQVTPAARKGWQFEAGDNAWHFKPGQFEFDFSGLEHLHEIMPNLEHFHSEEWREEMEKLREELEKLKQELKKKDQ